MDDTIAPDAVTMRELLAHFRATLAHARQTGAPVIIALRHNRPVGVLLDHTTWLEHVQARAAERARAVELAAQLAAAQAQVAELSATLEGERQPRGWQTDVPQERATGWQSASPAATGWGRPAGG